MDQLTLTARIDFPVDSPDAVLTINGHRYPILWDDEHTNPCPVAEQLMARYEGALLIGRWTPLLTGRDSDVPAGWTATAQVAADRPAPVLAHA